ncbi:hypothetical protein O0I10_013016 [Lichtheimia ornata]|uniref:ER membrane protein complex subunit 4 n=1 Tax=Lichtheimia ornata TaxID=688661 RepID=A0AAD7URP0_9FUNG|nr:uncharacterized protein O0I10_013016 [Lichtheimia ornata]KAJ8651434.1 hypothetical protein O0I10_013016 [Lichtheimia ornata]
MPDWSIDYASISANKRTKAVANPVGYEPGALSQSKGASKSARQTTTQDAHNDSALKIRRAWDVAWGPAKSIPMNAIMIYMTGNGVQIFSVMITIMLFLNPAKAIMSLQQTFGRFESKETAAELIVPKLLFIGLHLLTVLLGVYKVNAMGLLPTTTSDWLAFLPHKQMLEHVEL